MLFRFTSGAGAGVVRQVVQYSKVGESFSYQERGYIKTDIY